MSRSAARAPRNGDRCDSGLRRRRRVSCAGWAAQDPLFDPWRPISIAALYAVPAVLAAMGMRHWRPLLLAAAVAALGLAGPAVVAALLPCWPGPDRLQRRLRRGLDADGERCALEGAVRRRLRRDEQRPLLGRFEERGHQNRHIIGGVERGVDVAMTDVDEGSSCRVCAFHAVVSVDVDQLTLDDDIDHGLCNAHHLRELVAAAEAGHEWAEHLAEVLRYAHRQVTGAQLRAQLPCLTNRTACALSSGVYRRDDGLPAVPCNLVALILRSKFESLYETQGDSVRGVRCVAGGVPLARRVVVRCAATTLPLR